MTKFKKMFILRTDIVYQICYSLLIIILNYVPKDRDGLINQKGKIHVLYKQR